MINLLPPIYRQALRSNRLNSLLRHWLIIIWLASAGLVVILAAGWLYINQQTKNLNTAIADTNSQLAAQNLDQVQKDAKNLTNNIKTINQVLGQEIRFSDLIQDIGKVMPSGSVLNSLTLSKASGTLDLSASAKDYASAAQIAVNLSDPKNQIFNKVDIVSITCGSTSNYPCGGTFKTLFSKTAQARYLGVAKEAQ